MVLERLCRDAVDVLDRHRHLAADARNARKELQFLPWATFETPKEPCDWIPEAEKQWNEGQQATSLNRARVNLEGPREIVGGTYLDCFWERRAGEMVVWTRKSFWGRGMLREFALGLPELAYLDFDLEMMIAECFEETEPLLGPWETYAESFDGH